MLAASTGAAFAQFDTRTYGLGSNSGSHHVQQHTNSNGSTIGGHYQTNPNSTGSDNYGALGNLNPHNGGIGDGYGHSRSNSLFGNQ
jgi:hypothetical protein